MSVLDMRNDDHCQKLLHCPIDVAGMGSNETCKEKGDTRKEEKRNFSILIRKEKKNVGDIGFRKE